MFKIRYGLILLLSTAALSQSVPVQVPVSAQVAAMASAVAGVLPTPNNTSANWKNAGLLSMGGIATIDAARTKTCASVSPSGKIPPASGDDDALIVAAEATCAANRVLMLGTSACTCAAPCVFQISQSEAPILVNKSITVRGFGNACSSVNSAGAWWPVVVKVYDGALADWTISPTQDGAQCGVTAASFSGCTAASGVFLLSPSGNYVWGWGGCYFGSTATRCGTTLAADVAQGAMTVQIASTANFSAGMFVLIDENPQVVSTANPTGGAAVQASSDFLVPSPSPATLRLEGGDEPAAYSFPPNRLNAEIHLVTSVGSGPCPGTNCTLTFDDPLTLAFRQSGGHNAQVYWPTQNNTTANPFLQKAGIENMTILKAANGGIQMTFCAYCFVSHVEVFTWIAGAVNTNYSIRDEIDSNYFHTGADLENNGVEYPIGISAASTEILVQDNIVLLGGKGMVARAANSSVVAYNYMDDTMYQAASIGDYWNDMDINGSHYAGTHHFLFEGNWGSNCDGDETHGNSVYHTFFRNDCTGIRTTFIDPSINKTVNDAAGIGFAARGAPNPSAPLRAAGPMAFDYWYAYVGNVLGLAGVTTTANGWVYRNTNTKTIWMSGWVGAEWPRPDPNLNTNTKPFIFRHGNYDYVNASIADWTSGFSQTLPNSLYTTTKPAFFSNGTCTYPWPWVNSQVSPFVMTNSCGGSGLPAKARWAAGTPFVQP
jgi:hypothetical protein